MNTENNYEPRYAVEPELLLQYIIEKSEELSTKNFTGFPLPFKVFGSVALDAYPLLQKEFMKIVERSDDPVSERAARCKDIFVDASRREDWNPKHCSQENDEAPSIGRGVLQRFAWAARRDGEEMVEHKDFRFLSVWEMLCFLAFHTDAEKLKEFEQICLQNSEPEQKIERVIPFLWEMITVKPEKN